jgi:tetratricopeptide (TPR) repeat protein
LSERDLKSRLGSLGVRLLGIFIGLFFLVGLELILRAFGLGDEYSGRDPFYGFKKPLPLFEQKGTRDGFTLYSSDTSWQAGQFNVQEFVLPKPDGSFRVFCFGGSAVFGFPYWDPGSFPRLIEKGLAGASPFQRYEVINAGGMGYASNRVRLLLNESFAYDPDLIVLYTGNNEFLEKQFYFEVLDEPGWVLNFRAMLYQVRVYGLIARPVLWVRDHFFGAGPGPGERRFFDESGWLAEKEHVNWTQEKKRKVEKLFAWNLAEIIRSCRDQGVLLLLINPAVNLRDYPPNLSASSSSDEGVRGAREIFILGQSALERGDVSEAREYLIRAADEDLMPTRITSPLLNIMKDKGLQEDVIYFSAQELFDTQSRDGISGNNLFFDHCHPVFDGNYLIAREIIRVLIDNDIIEARPDWEELFDSAARKVFASFPNEYLAAVYYREAFFLHRHMDRPRRARELIEQALWLDPNHEAALELKKEIEEKIEQDNPLPWY